MSDFDLVIRNGVVATAADTARCDVGVRGGRIVALAESLGRGEREINASGRLVLPGGIDSHCHIDQPSSSGARTADDFLSGTISAACGGNTTIIPFACQYRGQSLREVVAEYHRRAEGKPVIDYAFHLIVTDPTPQALGQDLPALIRDGYTSVKVYTTYDRLKIDDYQFLEVLALARREGGIVMVHAENHDIIRWLGSKLIEAGHTAPKFHAVAHDRLAERDASQRAITLAEIVGVPLLIVHVSGSEAAEQIRLAQAQGLRVYGETCTQYLVLSDENLDVEGWDGAMHVCTPPPRDKANQEAIWRGLATGVFQVVSSDHAPFRYDDPKGKLLHGKGAPFNKIPPGIPGIEVRLPILFSEGVGKGRITLNQFVALGATNHARIYGLYPRKGTIAVGADADIAIWDPEKEVVISAEMLHDNMDYTPYEGTKVRGWPVVTISRGEIIVDHGEVKAAPGRGAFLRCEATPPDTSRQQARSRFDPVTGAYREHAH
jgi:dihydropyrimidinase